MAKAPIYPKCFDNKEKVHWISLHRMFYRSNKRIFFWTTKKIHEMRCLLFAGFSNRNWIISSTAAAAVWHDIMVGFYVIQLWLYCIIKDYSLAELNGDRWQVDSNLNWVGTWRNSTLIVPTSIYFVSTGAPGGLGLSKEENVLYTKSLLFCMIFFWGKASIKRNIFALDEGVIEQDGSPGVSSWR